VTFQANGNKQGKVRLKKEWLIFLPLFVLSAVAWTLSGFGEEYIEALFFRNRISEAILAWLLTLAPYLLVQLIRSIVWAIQTLRSASD
jgi:hypothetical protein